MTEAQWRVIATPAGDIYYSPDYGVFGVRFFEPGDDHGAAGVGPATLYFDSEDGRNIGDWIPWRGTAGDLFLQIQFPLHSGRIAGLPGRIFISAMGLVVAMLAVTGVIIWQRKRRARRVVKRHGQKRIGKDNASLEPPRSRCDSVALNENPDPDAPREIRLGHPQFNRHGPALGAARPRNSAADGRVAEGPRV